MEAVVQAASIHTNQSMRDDHLRTNDFLDVAELPDAGAQEHRAEAGPTTPAGS